MIGVDLPFQISPAITANLVSFREHLSWTYHEEAGVSEYLTAFSDAPTRRGTEIVSELPCGHRCVSVVEVFEDALV